MFSKFLTDRSISGGAFIGSHNWNLCFPQPAHSASPNERCSPPGDCGRGTRQQRCQVPAPIFIRHASWHNPRSELDFGGESKDRDIVGQRSLVPQRVLHHLCNPDVPVSSSLPTDVQIGLPNSDCVCIRQPFHLVEAVSGAQDVAVVDEGASTDNLEMPVAELLANEDRPGPGSHPGKCSSNYLLPRGCSSSG